MNGGPLLRSGDRVLVGTSLVEVTGEFAASLQAGDKVVGVAGSGQLRRVPGPVVGLVDAALTLATEAFSQLQSCPSSAVDAFFSSAARRVGDDAVFADVLAANAADVENARSRGRSTTRLVLSDVMRRGMVEALEMWGSMPARADAVNVVSHDGWRVEEHRAPLGVIGFVFEGRPNVFADATGVLRGGNTVVFRIGSDALGTARALMEHVVSPALTDAGLPVGAVQLVDSPEHAAGWALFADDRLALAVARGSGEAVAELGAIARQAGTPVSLHGTGGAWMIVGETFDESRLSSVVEHSLDRKVCNTLNTLCVVDGAAARAVPVILAAAERAAARRGRRARVHFTPTAQPFVGPAETIPVGRSGGETSEQNLTVCSVEHLGHEFEWEDNPEFHLHVVADVASAVALFNRLAPRFIVSCVSSDPVDHRTVWEGCDAPFVGDGFTRWVDGQFALLRPELGLSNWQSGRLFARSAILSGDSAFTVRLRVTQEDPDIHR